MSCTALNVKRTSLVLSEGSETKVGLGCKNHGARESRFFYWNVYVFNETHPYILTLNGDEI